MDAETGLETKVIAGEDVNAMGEFLNAFEAFKDANDQRLAQIEQRMSADVVTTEKVERIDKALDELTLKMKRPQLGTNEKPQASEHKAAFEAYVRKGESVQLSGIESKAMSVGSNPDGGYLVPPETEAYIESVLKLVSPIRAVAGVRQVSSSLYKKPFAISGAVSGWVGETAARPETAAPALAELQFPTMELYAMPAATQSLLDDAAVNLEEWLAGEVQQVFAEQEGQAFVTGNGTNRPKGFLAYTNVADASWSWGNLGYIATGTAGAFPASNPADKLMDLAYALKSGYRQNARWTMNRKTQSVIRKFKDSQGNYLWQPALSAAASATLLGFPVTEVEHMPDIATDAFALGFGDFARGYLIVDRVGVRIIRDPYSSKPYVLFYTTKRIGGGVQNFEAIKLMKFGVA
jgi:HK97 family phage major capsid protein